MNHKKRSPGVAAPRLQESKKYAKSLSRFGANSNPNQGKSKETLLADYRAALADAEVHFCRVNLLRWKAAIHALREHTL